MDGTTVACHQFCQIHNLLFCTLAGVRRRVEIYSVNLHTALCDHISCHWAVYAAGQKKHGFSSGSHRHSAGSWDHLGVQIYLIPDLQMDKYIRLVYIHFHIGARIQNRSAQLCVQLHRIHGIALLGPSHIHLKCHFSAAVYFFYIGDNSLCKLIISLILQHNSGTDTIDAEHTLQRLHSLLIIKSAAGKYIDPASFFHHIKGPVHIFQHTADLIHQSVLKDVPVLSFDGYLCIFYQKCFIHILFLSFINALHTCEAQAVRF